MSVPLSDENIFVLEDLFYSLGLEGLTYGISITVGIMSIYILVRQGLGLGKALARSLLCAACILMLVASTIIFASDLAFQVINLRLNRLGTNLEDVDMSGLTKDLQVNVAFVRVNFVLADMIVVWRAWVLIESPFLRASLALCMLGTIGCTITDGVLTIIGIANHGPAYAPSSILRLILFVPLLVTNVVSTAIIAYKAWAFRQMIKDNLHNQPTARQVERMLVLLVESGVLYCAPWILFLLSDFSILRSTAADLLTAIFPFTSSIYPTLIILLVAVENTTSGFLIEHTPMQSIVFASTANSISTQSRSIVQTIAVHVQTNRTSVRDEESPPPNRSRSRTPVLQL